MADSFVTAANLLTINDRNLSGGEASNLRNAAPLVMRMAAVMASQGTQHKYLRRTAAAGVGFRTESVGRENTKGTDTAITETLKLLDCSFAVDSSLADAYQRGPQAYVGREAMYSVAQGLYVLEQQVLYGTDNDASGFTGFAQYTNLDDSDDAMVVNAGGTTANTGSSVFGIRTDPMSDCALIVGNQGRLDVAPTVQQAIQDAANGGRFDAYWTRIQGHFGVQQGSIYSVGRICNLTEDSGKGLTDALLSDLIGLYPASRRPTYFVMSVRSCKQLQQSRTATNATGAPAEWPTEAFGVPIIVSDAVSDTEALLTAA